MKRFHTAMFAVLHFLAGIFGKTDKTWTMDLKILSVFGVMAGEHRALDGVTTYQFGFGGIKGARKMSDSLTDEGELAWVKRVSDFELLAAVRHTHTMLERFSHHRPVLQHLENHLDLIHGELLIRGLHKEAGSVANKRRVA